MRSLWKADDEDAPRPTLPFGFHNKLLFAGRVTWLEKDDGGFELVLQPRPERSPDHQIVSIAPDDAVNRRSQVQARRASSSWYWLLIAAVIGYKRDPITDHLVVPRRNLCQQEERSASEGQHSR